MPTQVKQTGTWIWACEIAKYATGSQSLLLAGARFLSLLCRPIFFYSAPTPLPLGLFDANVLLYFFFISMPNDIKARILICPKKCKANSIKQ